MFGTAQGSGPMPSRSPSSSILLVVGPSPIVVISVLPIVASLPAPLVVQDRGVGGQSAHVFSGPLSFVKTLIDKGK